MALRIHGRERRVEGPAGIDPADEQGVEGHRPSQHKEVPAEEIQARKRQIPRADHQGNQKIAERHRHRRHQEEPHHHDAMHGKEPVVGFGGSEQPFGHDQIQAHQRRGKTADEEEHRDRAQIQKRNALVIGGQEPTPEGEAVREVRAFDLTGLDGNFEAAAVAFIWRHSRARAI